MVFNPTQGRKVFTQPTGMPDLSGFKSAAKSYQQLGGIIADFGTQKRVGDYNEAVRQAQIDGKTAGVKYTKGEDGQWKLSPLVNLDYSKAVQGLPEQDRQGVLDAHREAAVGTYVAAAVNDINSAANRSLIDNPNDPDKIRADMNGYAQGLRDSVDESIYAQIAPKIEGAFLSVENQAFAQQQKELNQQGIAELSRKFNANTRDLGNLYAVGPTDDEDASVEGFEMRVQEIIDEDEVTLKNLATKGVTEDKIQALRDQRANAIGIRIGQSVVEKAFIEGGENGYSNALKAIEQVLDDAYKNPDLDPEKLRIALSITANSLERIKQANFREDTKIRQSAYQSVIKRVLYDNESVADMIVNQDPMLDLLEPSQIMNLQSQSTAFNKQAVNDEFQPAKNLIANWKAVIASGSSEAEDSIIEAFLTVRRLKETNKINDAQYYETLGNYLEYYDTKVRGPDRIAASTFLKRELGEFSSFALHHENFLQRTDALVASGVIGKSAGAGWDSIDSYHNDIATYKKNRKKKLEEVNLSSTASSKLALGLTLGTKEQDAYIKTHGYDKAIMGDGTVVKINLYSQDEQVFTASVDTVASFALSSKGMLLPEALDVINQARFSDEATDKANRILGQTFNLMMSQSDQPRYAVMYDLFEKNNLSEETRTYLTLATTVGISAAQEIVKNPVDYNRGLNSYFGTRIKDGNAEEVADEFLEETFNKTLTMNQPFGVASPILMTLGQALGVNKDDPQRERFIQEFASTHNISVTDVNDIVINNPVVRNAMKDLFYSRLLTHGKAVAPEQIMFGVLTTIGKRYGLEENQRTGKIEMISNPILNQAQATVPLDDDLGRNGQPIVKLDHEMIVNDIVQSVMSVPGIGTEEYYSALQEVGSGSNIRFHANDDLGGKQTYTAVLYDKIGKPYLLSENYTYDFKYSFQNESYKNAISEIKSSKIKNFLSLGGLLDRTLLQNTFEKWDESKEPSSFDPIVKKINEVYFALGTNSDYLRTDEEIEPFTTKEIEELWRLKETILSFGFK